MATKAVAEPNVKSISLEIVSNGPRLARKLKGGRPVKLTPRSFVMICRFIEAGGTETAACESVRIRYRTLHLHVTQKENWKKRLERAREVRKAVWHEMHIQNILKQAPKNVIASLWWLERNFPDRYALRTVQRNVNSHELLVLDKVSAETLEADARLALEVAKEQPALRT
jgi:hypothetical protein